ncbi:MAG TPA: cobalamin-dependent protein [Thermodesulfobacteriota bacterium]|nr:cobalamin-dependent protein [Thermodesulfobacteriota bacterium]
MGKVDCLFLHVPKLINYYRPIDQFIWINFLPMGLLALADFLQRHDISTQVLHLGVEWIEGRNFSILDYLRENDPRIVAFDLHWHHQSFDVIEMAKKVKASSPSTFIVLGGYTASFFHEEIMKDFDAVDGIIRGEAEIPMLELARALLQGGKDLFSVPNLTWRRKGRILMNPLSYVASEEDLNNLSFTNFPLLKNYSTYIRYLGQPFYVRGVSKEKNFWMYSLKSPIYHLPVGRGCPVQCTWCGGGHLAQKEITGRREVIFRGINEVIQTIKEALSYGYETFHICFDPFPKNPDYYLRLFSRLREEKIRSECFFESFGLPTVDFILSFKETFPGPKSLIALSPDVGSVRTRRIHKGYPYTNQALTECLDQLEQHQVYCDLFFALGVPFERKEDVYQTIRFQRDLRSRYPYVKGIRTFTIEMEPGSPWHLHPELFGVKTDLRNFIDFYHYHSGKVSPFSSMGYWIPNFFGNENGNDEKGFEEALQKIKCRHFCFIHPDARKSSNPFWGRRLCDLSHLFWRAKNLGRRRL